MKRIVDFNRRAVAHATIATAPACDRTYGCFLLLCRSSSAHSGRPEALEIITQKLHIDPSVRIGSQKVMAFPNLRSGRKRRRPER